MVQTSLLVITATLAYTVYLPGAHSRHASTHVFRAEIKLTVDGGLITANIHRYSPVYVNGVESRLYLRKIRRVFL
ncbi:hypothetical protein C8Q72DRAFT_853619 [Fomitopsis betulina]|nr:hypothetical protein C8Q72DRAFT_853619 [Fomitopsis betulina]